MNTGGHKMELGTDEMRAHILSLAAVLLAAGSGPVDPSGLTGETPSPLHDLGISGRGTKKEFPMQMPAWVRELCLRTAHALDHSHTLGELTDAYLEALAPKQRRGMEKWLGRVPPALGDLPLSALTDRHIEQLHASIEAPYVANRVVDSLHAALRRGERWGWIENNPAKWRGEYKHPERPRKRILSPSERSRMWAKLVKWEATGSAAWRMRSLGLQLLALTGLRRSEVIGVPWATVYASADPPRIDLHKTKTGDKVVYLSPGAVSVLGRIDTDRDCCVLPWASCRPLALAWGQLRTECGFPDVRLHDLRRTFWSCLGEIGVDPATAATAAGHGSVEVHVAHYRHVSASRLAETMALGGAAMKGELDNASS